jgi:cell division transport system permease protein
MKLVSYAVGEALLSLRRSGRSAVMAVGTIGVAFLTLAGFLLVASNLQQLVDRWMTAAELSVYLRDGIDDDARSALARDLGAHGAVAAVEYVSKEQALERFKGDFPELADVAVSESENPFPASFEVRLRTDPSSAASADALVSDFSQRSGVADVQYNRAWLARLSAIIDAVSLAGVALTAVLMVGAAFTVAAVVRLSLFARRSEIEIMRLVGAPFAYIRGPSVAEGTLLGAVGASLALIVLWVLFEWAREPVTQVIAPLTGHSNLRFLGVKESLVVISTALGIGGLSGVVASRAVG